MLDKFELKKPGGRPEAAYLSKVYPEETLELAYDAVPCLTGSLSSAPRTNLSAQAQFTLHPLKSARQPVQLEMSLTPESARDYELEGESLRVITPAIGEPDKDIATRVRARVKDATDGIGGRLLSPPLIFQARTKSRV